MNEIFDTLANNSSRLFKIELLKTHKNDETLKRVCFLALDPFTQFYVRKIPKYTPNHTRGMVSLQDALVGLDKLSSRQVTGNAARDYLRELLESVQSDDAKIIERVIKKDLKCGVNASTVNKVWSKLVPTYPCMLASVFDQKIVDKIKFPAYVQVKADGMRFNAIVRNGAVELRSRNGKEITIADPSFLELIHELSTVYCADNVVFDGELLVVDDAGNLCDRKTGNGILNKAVKGTQKPHEGARVRALLWDVIPLSSFEAGICKIPYQARLQSLIDAVNSLDNVRLSVIRTHLVSKLEEAQDWFQMYLEEGEEGIILKSKDLIWEDKRSKKQIKFKGEYECDLEVVGWVEGTGKHAGRLGALSLASADGELQVNVGTGFTDEDRDTITKDDVGRIVAIKYNGRIKDKRKNTDSLFLPVFIEFRDDKDAADSSGQVK